MKPQLFGMSAYFQLWILAAIFGIGEGLRLLRRAGFRTGPALLALCLLAVVILLGSKLLFVVEYRLLPYDDPVLMPQSTASELLRHGFRIPGGIVLMGLVAPLLCRMLRLPTARFVDAFIPCVGLALMFIRTGCFLQGCCFGARTDGPLGMQFPAGSHVYEYQLLQHDIGWNATAALPVYPLQLYFVGLGALMYLLGLRWQRTKQFDGEVWAKEYLLFFGGTFLLELVRAVALRLNLFLTATVFVVVALMIWRGRQTAPATAPLRP
jgi:phosphatidylglycerol:prolipoprotein diacylglycerol transferase